jgi:hypothetical protein
VKSVGVCSVARMVADNQPSLERSLITMVRQARRTAATPGRTRKHVQRTARRRLRRMALGCVLVGPFAGVVLRGAAPIVEAATVWDLADTHGLGLSEDLVAAHLLVLWAVTPDYAEAHAALERRGTNVSTLLARRLGDQLPDRWSRRNVAAVMWRSRRLAKDAREIGPSAVFGTVLRPGPRAKAFIERAERQLGVK